MRIMLTYFLERNNTVNNIFTLSEYNKNAKNAFILSNIIKLSIIFCVFFNINENCDYQPCH